MRFIAAVAVILLPSIIGWLRAPSFVIETPINAFDLGLEWLTVVFPLLAGFMGTYPLIGAVRGRWLQYAAPRAPLAEFLTRRLFRDAAVAGAVFAVSMWLWSVVCFWLDPLVGHSHNFGVAPSGQSVLDGTMWGALVSVSPWVFGLVYGAWLGGWAFLFSILTGVCVLLIPRTAIALAVPLVLWSLDATILQSTPLGGMNIIFTVFPFNMFGQPAWMTVASVCVWVAIGAGALLAMRRRAPALEGIA